MHCAPTQMRGPSGGTTQRSPTQVAPGGGVMQVPPTQVRPLAVGGGICGIIDQEACVQITGIGLVNSRCCGECIKRPLAISLDGGAEAAGRRFRQHHR